MIYVQEILPKFQHQIIHTLCEQIDSFQRIEFKQFLASCIKSSCDLSSPVNREQRAAFENVINDIKRSKKIISLLEGLHRHQYVLLKIQDEGEKEEIRENIRLYFHELDAHEVPFSVQNKVLYAAQNGKAFNEIEDLPL